MSGWRYDHRMQHENKWRVNPAKSARFAYEFERAVERRGEEARAKFEAEIACHEG